MDKIGISAQGRNAEEKSTQLLQEGLIPGVVYGHSFDNLSIKVSQREFMKLLEEAGESTLIDLKVGEQEIGKVVIKDYQVSPVSGAIIHFDLHKVKMTEKLIVNVDLSFVGESPAVKNEGGVLVTGQDSIEIRCLPKDLIQEVEVDLSQLEHIDDLIRVRDLKLPDTVEVLDEEENVVVAVEPQRSEEEMGDLEEKPQEDMNKVAGAVKEEKAAEAGKEKK